MGYIFQPDNNGTSKLEGTSGIVMWLVLERLRSMQSGCQVRHYVGRDDQLPLSECCIVCKGGRIIRIAESLTSSFRIPLGAPFSQTLLHPASFIANMQIVQACYFYVVDQVTLVDLMPSCLKKRTMNTQMAVDFKIISLLKVLRRDQILLCQQPNSPNQPV